MHTLFSFQGPLLESLPKIVTVMILGGSGGGGGGGGGVGGYAKTYTPKHKHLTLFIRTNGSMQSVQVFPFLSYKRTVKQQLNCKK